MNRKLKFIAGTVILLGSLLASVIFMMTKHHNQALQEAIARVEFAAKSRRIAETTARFLEDLATNAPANASVTLSAAAAEIERRGVESDLAARIVLQFVECDSIAAAVRNREEAEAIALKIRRKGITTLVQGPLRTIGVDTNRLYHILVPLHSHAVVLELLLK